MVTADTAQVENDVVFVVEGTANLLPHFETLKKNYIEPALEDFNNGPILQPDGFGGEYGSNQYCLVLYGTASSAPDAAAHCVIHTRDVFEFYSFLENLRFDGGCGEEYSLLAEGLSLAMQIFDDLKTTRKPQSAPVKRSCIVIANAPPYNIPSRECLNNEYNLTSEKLAEVMANKNGINLSIIAPRKIPALQKIFEKSRREENAHSLSKEYSKNPKHMVYIQGFLLPANQSSPMAKDSPSGNADKTSPAGTQIKQDPPSTKTPTGGIDGVPSTTASQGNPLSNKKISGQLSPSPAQPSTAANQLGPFSVPGSSATPVRPNVTMATVRPVEPSDFGFQQQVPNPMNAVVPVMSGAITQPFPSGPTPTPVVISQPAPPVHETPNPNPASQPRKLVWNGQLEWQDAIRSDPNRSERITRSLACQVSVANGDMLKTEKWPNKLIMQLIPQNLLSSLGPLLQSSKTVAFHFAANDPDSLKALYRVMASTGVKFAGCVHFPPAHQCEVKVLLLIFSPRKKAFVGLIPHDQGSFVIGIRSVVASHRTAQIKKLQQAQAQAAQSQAAQAAQAQAAQVQAAQAQAAQAQAAQVQAAAQAQAAQAQQAHRNSLLLQLQQQQQQQQQQQSQGSGFPSSTAAQFVQQNPNPGIPGVGNPIPQLSMLSSQNQGIEVMVPSSQTSLPSSLGIPAATAVGSSGATTSLQTMVSTMDQSDGLRQQQAMYQPSSLGDAQKQLLIAQAVQARQQQQQQLHQLQQQQLQKAQQQAQQQAQNAQQAQQAKAQAQAHQVQAQAQAQAAQAAQAQAPSLRHLLQQNQGSAQTQQWQNQQLQQRQLLLLRQQQAAQQMNQQQINPTQMSQVQAQMTQAQMVQSQAQMTPGQAAQSQMMQQQLSQTQALFPEDVTLIDLLQTQQP